MFGLSLDTPLLYTAGWFAGIIRLGHGHPDERGVVAYLAGRFYVMSKDVVFCLGVVKDCGRNQYEKIRGEARNDTNG